VNRRFPLVIVLSLASGGCPYDTLVSNGGLAIAGGGGTASDQLVFTVQPSNAVAGQIITPAVRVAARDSLGNVDTSFAANVTISIGVNPVGGNLGGTTTVPAVAGVALFGDLTIDRSGQGYTLRASAPGAQSASSDPFDILAPSP
jgi:hypothetical protein